MPRRTRTAKKLAQRIDLNYFKRPHPFRRWRFLLSVALPVVTLLWLAWKGAVGNKDVYSSGPVSSAHAVFGERCDACHVTQAGVFREHVTDEACLACHDGPVHNVKQFFTPRCAACHLEHRGPLKLAHTSDRSCTQCHASLKTKEAPAAFEPVITGFNTRHPEFAPLRPGQRDLGTIKLNHEVHLKSDLRTPDGLFVQLHCADCHRPPAVNASWPYGEAKFRTVAAAEKADPLASVPPSAYMAPIEYAKNCVSCHPLLFDERFLEPVPHEKPEVVRAFVVKKFTEYIARHPAELRQVSRFERRLPGQPPPPPPRVLTPGQWVAERVAVAERLLWNKTCKECHTLTFPASGLPAVAKPAMPVRWLPHAKFDHEAHRMLACTACHTGVPTSRETSDLLLPGIQVCQQCHHQETQEAAEGRCFECHFYHDWSQKQQVKGKFTIEALTR